MPTNHQRKSLSELSNEELARMLEELKQENEQNSKGFDQDYKRLESQKAAIQKTDHVEKLFQSLKESHDKETLTLIDEIKEALVYCCPEGDQSQLNQYLFMLLHDGDLQILLLGNISQVIKNVLEKMREVLINQLSCEIKWHKNTDHYGRDCFTKISPIQLCGIIAGSLNLEKDSDYLKRLDHFVKRLIGIGSEINESNRDRVSWLQAEEKKLPKEQKNQNNSSVSNEEADQPLVALLDSIPSLIPPNSSKKAIIKTDNSESAVSDKTQDKDILEVTTEPIKSEFFSFEPFNKPGNKFNAVTLLLQSVPEENSKKQYYGSSIDSYLHSLSLTKLMQDSLFKKVDVAPEKQKLQSAKFIVKTNFLAAKANNKKAEKEKNSIDHSVPIAKDLLEDLKSAIKDFEASIKQDKPYILTGYSLSVDYTHNVVNKITEDLEGELKKSNFMRKFNSKYSKQLYHIRCSNSILHQKLVELITKHNTITLENNQKIQRKIDRIARLPSEKRQAAVDELEKKRQKYIDDLHTRKLSAYSEYVEKIEKNFKKLEKLICASKDKYKRKELAKEEVKLTREKVYFYQQFNLFKVSHPNCIFEVSSEGITAKPEPLSKAHP